MPSRSAARSLAGSLAISGRPASYPPGVSLACALALGSKSATPATWMKLFLRLLEARDGIALPCFGLPLLAPFLRLPLRTLGPLLPLRRLFLFRSLGACVFHPAPLR